MPRTLRRYPANSVPTADATSKADANQARPMHFHTRFAGTGTRGRVDAFELLSRHDLFLIELVDVVGFLVFWIDRRRRSMTELVAPIKDRGNHDICECDRRRLSEPDGLAVHQ